MEAPRATSGRLELADLFRAYGDRLNGLTSQQQRAVHAITSCRTAALGGHAQTCDHCGHSEIRYNSCRNRHCPKCQSLDKARWVEARKDDVLPVEYHHVVFTIPQELHAIFLSHPRSTYNLLFHAVSQTLLEVAANPRNLGGKIGFTALLHTWTQTLLYHPHIHAIVPGGGISAAGDRWVSSKPGFFLPVKVLSILFRAKLLSSLEKAAARGDLPLPAGKDPRSLLVEASRKNWVVYSKPPMAGAEQVIEYLGRYTHRIALSNERLVSTKDDQVSFRWKDRPNGNREKTMTLGAVEFLKRFLLHVLPSGLVRIRHYGFLANAVRRRKTSQCRVLLNSPPKERGPIIPRPPEPWHELLLRLTGRDVTKCRQCKLGRMMDAAEIPRAVAPWRIPGSGVAS